VETLGDTLGMGAERPGERSERACCGQALFAIGKVVSVASFVRTTKGRGMGEED
jgi:hypothetical protein